ncbi:hypothetical protein [Nocardia sp. NPDC052566]|uniref:hypothetical protein n=1 Tax=Nocardia sp. NPDC052566 TaxID=3364330 RepID=UPI0037CACED0
MKPTKIAVLALAAAALWLGGCSEAEKAVNPGGDTKCTDFVRQDADKQRVTVAKFLEQESGDRPTPDARTVDAAVASIQLMCSAQANPETPIKKADLTGILVPK